MRLDGIHHVTCITGDAPANVDFYTGVLGLRLVKKTVNQDDPTVYHLFYADEKGPPGAARIKKKVIVMMINSVGTAPASRVKK